MKRKAEETVIYLDEEIGAPGPSGVSKTFIEKDTSVQTENLVLDTSPNPDDKVYFKLLEQLKPLRWNLKKKWNLFPSKKSKEEKTAERKEMLRLCALLAPIAPTPELERSLNTNATKLESYLNVFPARFIKEGENCLCEDGKFGLCKRFMWNCQWTYHSQRKGFCAQRNRCVDGSKLVYTASNDVV